MSIFNARILMFFFKIKQMVMPVYLPLKTSR